MILGFIDDINSRIDAVEISHITVKNTLKPFGWP